MKHIFNNLSEEEKNNILEQHAGGKEFIIENFNKLVENKLGDVKPLVNEQGNLGGTGQQGGGSNQGTGYYKQPVIVDKPKSITLSKDSFKTGSDVMDTTSSEYQELKKQLTNLLNSKGKINAQVIGSASSVGNKQGYDNEALAKRRAEKLVSLLYKEIPGIQNKVNFSISGQVVPNTDTPESKEALAAQKITVNFSIPNKTEVPRNVEADNTVVGVDNKKIVGGKQKRVCVKIPEAFVEDYKKMLREFKNKHMLKSLPFGVYDV